MAGVVPVPVFPPDPRRQSKDLNTFASIQVGPRQLRHDFIHSPASFPV
jgi:hypothetical protein